MIQPISDQASEQVRTAEERTIRWCCPSQRQVIATACSSVPAIEHELFSSQPAQARLFIERDCVVHKVAPIRGGMDVHFDDTRVGRYLDHTQSWIVWRRITLHENRHIERGRCVFY